MEAEVAAKLSESKENYGACFIFQYLVNMAFAGEEEGWRVGKACYKWVYQGI